MVASWGHDSLAQALAAGYNSRILYNYAKKGGIMFSTRYSLIFTLIVFFSSLCAHEPVIIHTLYGSDVITEPVLIELLESRALNRLHHINQYGIMKFVKPEEEYTRYQHSVAVLYLLRKYGASLEEQVMGLLHDVSHTAFSHVADFLFNTVQHKYSYQDTIFAYFVAQTDLQEILDRHNLSWITDIAARDQFKMLKDDLPKLCADRLEYNLYGGYLEHLLTRDDIMMILESLEYKHGSWIFTDYHAARLFADTVLYLSEHIWCADWNCYIYSETAKLLKYGLEHDIFSEDELIFSDDATIWQRLHDAAANDSVIQKQIARIMHYKTGFDSGTPDAHDYVTQGKFRWIDPLVMTKAGPQLLSSIDRTFAEEIHTQRTRFKEPYYIKYVA